MTDHMPVGDLRERLAEALYRWTLKAAGASSASPPVHPRTLENLRVTSLARADAVLPVVEAETAALRTALKDAERGMETHRQRAEEAERERDEYRERFTNQMTAAIALVEKLQQAEAAVRRVQALLDPYPEGAVFAIHRGVGSERRVQAVLPSDVVRAALDAEQPKETP